MITKIKNLYSNGNFEYLTMDDFIKSIKFGNENTDTINILRSLEYKSNEYKKVKNKLKSCVMLHGEFSSISDSGLQKVSNYLFYDIDEVNNIDELKSQLIDLGINIIWKSPGGRGLHFLIECIGLSNEDFEVAHNVVYNHLFSLGIDVDKSAKGLCRKSYLSYDENIYVGNVPFVNVEKDFIYVGNVPYSKYKQCGGQPNKRDGRSKGNVPFYELRLIPIKQLLTEIKIKTKYEVKEDFVVNEIEWVDILIPKVINDGLKHTVYRRVMFQLQYLNPNITPNQVYSYLYHINKMRTNKPMDDLVLRKLCINTIEYVKTQTISVKMRKKKIHLNDRFTPEQKEELGGKINAKIRQNESIRKIKEAREILKLENKKETKKEISRITGLSEKTVSRNWNMNETEIKNLLPEEIDEKQLEIDYKISQIIEEDDWFSNWEPDSKLNEKSPEDEDFGESDGIDGLIETIKI